MAIRLSHRTCSMPSTITQLWDFKMDQEVNRVTLDSVFSLNWSIGISVVFWGTLKIPMTSFSRTRKRLLQSEILTSSAKKTSTTQPTMLANRLTSISQPSWQRSRLNRFQESVPIFMRKPKMRLRVTNLPPRKSHQPNRVASPKPGHLLIHQIKKAVKRRKRSRKRSTSIGLFLKVGPKDLTRFCLIVVLCRDLLLELPNYAKKMTQIKPRKTTWSPNSCQLDLGSGFKMRILHKMHV